MAVKLRVLSAVATVATLTLTAVGCGGSDAAGDGGDRELVLIAAAADNPFFNPMACGAKSVIEPEGGKLSVTAPQTPGDIPGMVQLVNAAIAKKPDAIIIDPVDPEAFTPALTKAREKGIKVILLDNTLGDDDAYDAAVATDNLQGGKLAGEEMVRALDGAGKVLTLGGIPGQGTLEARAKAFRDEIAAAPGMEDLGVEYSGQDITKAAGIVAATLAKDPDLAGIWATSYNEMAGALSALRRADKLDQVTLISFDTTEDQVEMVRTGELHALIGLSASGMGSRGAEVAYEIFDGNQVERDELSPTLLITKDNVDTPEAEEYFYTTDC